MILGALLLTTGQLWRNIADLGSPSACGFPDRATQTMLIPVADPSSKLSAANCQNRYPSPSKRSGLSRVRPQLSAFDGQTVAEGGLAWLLIVLQTAYHPVVNIKHSEGGTCRTSGNEQGNQICLIPLRFLPSQPFLRLARVATQILNVAQLVRLSVVQPLPLQAKTLQTACLSAVLRVRSAVRLLATAKGQAPYLNRYSTSHRPTLLSDGVFMSERPI